MDRIAAIVLAAGGSSRLGRPKQLLRMDGRCLVRRAADTALACRADEVCVVVGAAADAVESALDGLAVTVVENVDWRSGISTSIRCGLRHVRRDLSDVHAVLILLVDQPMLNAGVLNGLIDAFRNGAELVASEYRGSLGAPALFSHTYFDALSELTGDQGAKSVLHRHAGDVVAVPFPDGGTDIDTAEDWASVNPAAKP